MPPYLNPSQKSIYTFFALQTARILTTLYPHHTIQTSGPRRPDMIEQERRAAAIKLKDPA